MLASIGVSFTIHIQDVTAIKSLTNISTTSVLNETHPHTYDHLHWPLLTQNESKIKIALYKKYFMALIKMGNAFIIFGRNKLLHVFRFWFEEDVITL